MSKLIGLQKIKNSLKQIDYEKLCNILDAHLPRIPASIIQFENNKFELGQLHAGGMNLLYRARLVDETKIPFRTVKEISYIEQDKLHLIKYYGRVNKPGESMFYASSAIETACVETFSKGENFNKLKKEKSLNLIVGTWLVTKPMELAQMVSSEKYFSSFLEEAKSLNLKKVTLETIKEQNEYLRKQLNDDEAYNVLSFFSDEFAKTDTIDHNEYKLSNYYADRILSRNRRYKMEGNVDGIWYPSVPSSYQEINFVIPPKTVNDKLRFLSASIIWVIYSEDTNNIQFIPIEQRATANTEGIIQWRTKKIN